MSANWPRRSLASAGVGLVASTAVLTCAAPALADTALTASPSVLQSNWYWHKLNADAPAAGVPDPGEPSNVPTGDLPIATRDNAGTPSKIPLIAFDLPTDAVGGTVSAFTVTLTIDPNATNVMPDTPKLVAALALRNWANGTGGTQDTVNAPPADRSSSVPGVISTDGKSVSFAIPALAQSWADDSNFGLEVLPAKGYTTPFQVSFLGGKDVKAAMAYTPAAPTLPVSQPAQAAPPPAAGSSGTAPLTLSPDLGTGLSSGTAPLSSGTVPASGPQVAPQVQPGTPAVAPASVVQTAPSLQPVSSRPSAGLFWVAAAMAALLALVSLVLGGEPSAGQATSRSRLSAVLRQRASRPAPASAEPVRPSSLRSARA